VLQTPDFDQERVMAEPASPAQPAAFLAHNRAAPDWLRALPALIERLAERWSLTVGPPFPAIEMNYVAAARRADGQPCVLKVSRYVGETRTEIAALRLWDGDGAARLLESDPELGALLVERLAPGTMLVEVAERDDDAATAVAAGVLARLWRPPPAQPDLGGLRGLASWCAAYDRNRVALSRGAHGFPAALFARADALRAELLASTEAPVVLHGDLHHFNVLRAERAEWLAIDPKGLAGDKCFDVCQFLRNPRPVPASVNRRRLDLLCAELGLDRPRTRDWCLVHAVLDACWDVEEGKPWQAAVERALETMGY
jgi:streptomycin 6-kinase